MQFLPSGTTGAVWSRDGSLDRRPPVSIQSANGQVRVVFAVLAVALARLMPAGAGQEQLSSCGNISMESGRRCGRRGGWIPCHPVFGFGVEVMSVRI